MIDYAKGGKMKHSETSWKPQDGLEIFSQGLKPDAG